MARFTDRPAVRDGKSVLTYGELDRLSGAVCADLLSQGVGAEVRVGIMIERSLEMVVALIGVLRAGGSFVPLDPTLPQERRNFIIEDGEVDLILQAEGSPETLPYPSTTIVSLRKHAPVGRPTQSAEVRPGDLAYVIYTSGSTGSPKGVLVEHKSLANVISEKIRIHRTRPNDIQLLVQSLAFDGSLGPIFRTLACGATLFLAPPNPTEAAIRMSAILKHERITQATMTPSLLRALPSKDYPALHSIALGGEAVSWDLVEKWGYGRRILNGYGPTEATCSVTLYEITDNRPHTATVPIGKPYRNCSVYLFDDDGNPTVPGQAGEIFIGGIGVARGYAGDPALTQDRFLTDPYADNGGRMYRTGDLARMLSSGDYEYLGRIDRQVKVNGVRIEPAEVEAQILNDPHVESCAVVPMQRAGQTVLCAFVVAKGRLGVAELRERLALTLPPTFLPAELRPLKALPLTPSGKIDYRSLQRDPSFRRG